MPQQTSSTDADLHLKIPSHNTFAVIYVQINQLDGKAKTQFSLDQETWYNHIDWHPPAGSTTPLQIAFVLGSGVSGMTSKTPDNLQMVSAVLATVQTTECTDKFTVTKPDGTGEDPIIVVTPHSS